MSDRVTLSRGRGARSSAFRASGSALAASPSSWRREEAKAVVCGTEKRREEFKVSHEQTETNPAQPRERLENAGERHLCPPTHCLGKPVRGGLGADERRNTHGRKSCGIIRAAPG